MSKALQESLKDSNKLVRQAALAGISRSKAEIDVSLIANLLLDNGADLTRLLTLHFLRRLMRGAA